MISLDGATTYNSLAGATRIVRPAIAASWERPTESRNANSSRPSARARVVVVWNLRNQAARAMEINRLRRVLNEFSDTPAGQDCGQYKGTGGLYLRIGHHHPKKDASVPNFDPAIVGFGTFATPRQAFTLGCLVLRPPAPPARPPAAVPILPVGNWGRTRRSSVPGGSQTDPWYDPLRNVLRSLPV